MGVLDGSIPSTGSASGYDIFTTMASQSTQQAQMANGALGSGVDAFQKKDYSKAVSEFSRAIAMDPTNPKSYNLLATVYLQQNKAAEAVKAYKTSLNLDPYQDDVHRNIGNIYMSQKKYSDAEKEYKAAMKLNPQDTVAPYTLGQMYQQTQRYTEAEAQFNKVIRMAPKDPNPYYALGATLNKEGKYADAAKQLTQAVKLRPKMVAAQFELGVAYAGTGDTNKAQRQVALVKNLDAAQGALLERTIAQPKIMGASVGETDNFLAGLDPLRSHGLFEMGVLQPNEAKAFTFSFLFDSKMDPESVQNPQNWTLTKASGGAAGYYNNMQPVLPTDTYIPQNPTTVTYNPDKQIATVTFFLSQNANGDATIDPSHLVFKFSGQDMRGKTMDPTSDEYDGFAQTPF